MRNQGMSRRRLLAGGLALTAIAATGCSRLMGNGGALRIAEPDYLNAPDAYDRVTSAFAEISDSSVEQVSPPYVQYHSSIYTQLQAGSPPDIIRVDDPQIATYLDNDWLEPLDDVLTDLNLTVDDLVPAAKDMYVDGKLYGILAQTNPRAYIYNKKLFDQADLEPPTDLASFEEAIRKTTDADKGQFGIGFNTKQGEPTGVLNQLMPFVLGFDGNFYDGPNPTATAPKTVESLEFVQKLWKDNLMPRGLDSTAINNLMGEGKLASNINGAFIIFYAQDTNPEMAANLTTAPNPLPSQQTMRASALWSIPRSAKNPDAAKDYLKTFLDLEVQQQLQRDCGFVVARPEGISDSFVADNPWFEQIKEKGIDGTAVSYFPLEAGAAASDSPKIIGDAVIDILYNDADPSKAMQQVQSKLEAS